MDVNSSSPDDTPEVNDSEADIDTEDGYPDFVYKMYKHKKKKAATMSTERDSWYYSMNHKRRGIAIIFNHENFDICTLKARSGTEADCINLAKVLTNVGFDVKKYIDLNVKQIESVISEVSEVDHSDCDCFLVAVLSHGEQGIIYAKDIAYKPELLVDRFTPDKCPTLAGKPKIYLIQACQGDKLDPGIELERTHVDSDVYSYRIPLYADFLIACSTIPGFYSWRNTHKGSWFVQAFCDQMTEYGTEIDLLTLLTFVNRKVAIDFESNVPDNKIMHKQKQIPCIKSMLTRIVKFSPKTYDV